jgi:hypothetical protein
MEIGALEIQGFSPGRVGKSGSGGEIDTFYSEQTDPGCSILDSGCMPIDVVDATGTLPPKSKHIRASNVALATHSRFGEQEIKGRVIRGLGQFAIC